MNVVMYSTNCPRCKVLAQKLMDAGIEFRISDDVDEMIKRGFRSAPVLDADGEAMDFITAVNWIRNKEG